MNSQMLPTDATESHAYEQTIQPLNIDEFIDYCLSCDENAIHMFPRVNDVRGLLRSPLQSPVFNTPTYSLHEYPLPVPFTVPAYLHPLSAPELISQRHISKPILPFPPPPWNEPPFPELFPTFAFGTSDQQLPTAESPESLSPPSQKRNSYESSFDSIASLRPDGGSESHVHDPNSMQPLEMTKNTQCGGGSGLSGHNVGDAENISMIPFQLSEDNNHDKKLRRKIRNKISAQESRRKRKEYVEHLEKLVKSYIQESLLLKEKVSQLEFSNRNLHNQLHCFKSYFEKYSHRARGLLLGEEKSPLGVLDPLTITSKLEDTVKELSYQRQHSH